MENEITLDDDTPASNTIPMSKFDVHRVLTSAPRDVVTMLKNSSGTLWLGGGFIRAVLGNEDANDIDIFGTGKEQLEIVAQQLCDERVARGVRTKLHKTKNAITLLSADGCIPVQFITRWNYTRIHDVCASFDFTVCQAAIGFRGGLWHGVVDNRFYRDLAAKRLTYTSPQRDEEAGGSMLRVIKYARRGYNIQPASLGYVMARVVAGIKQERGIDMQDPKAVGFVLGGLLAEVDPTLVVDGLDLINDHETPNPDVGRFNIA